MKSKMRITILSTLLIICLVLGGAVISPVVPGNSLAVTSYAANDAVKAPTGLNSRRVSMTSVKLWWKKVDGAGGYVVYRYDKASKKYKALKTIKSAKTTKLIDKGLNKNKVYKYRVKSYKIVKGKKSYSDFSSLVISKTWSSGVKAVNVGSVKTTPKSLTLGLCMKKAVNAKVIPTRSSKANGKTAVNKTIRWKSSDRTIAKVNKNGLVTAQTKPGKCYIYAIAHNGVKKRITVKVKDYAKPAKFNLYGVSGTAADMLGGENKKAVCEIASYFTTHKPKGNLSIWLDGQNNFHVEPKTDLGDMAPLIEQFLLNQPHQVQILVNDAYIEFLIVEYCGEDKWGNAIDVYHHITYYYGQDITDSDLGDHEFRIAPHWTCFTFVPI